MGPLHYNSLFGVVGGTSTDPSCNPTPSGQTPATSAAPGQMDLLYPLADDTSQPPTVPRPAPSTSLLNHLSHRRLTLPHASQPPARQSAPHQRLSPAAPSSPQEGDRDRSTDGNSSLDAPCTPPLDRESGNYLGTCVATPPQRVEGFSVRSVSGQADSVDGDGGEDGTVRVFTAVMSSKTAAARSSAAAEAVGAEEESLEQQQQGDGKRAPWRSGGSSSSSSVAGPRELSSGLQELPAVDLLPRFRAAAATCANVDTATTEDGHGHVQEAQLQTSSADACGNAVPCRERVQEPAAADEQLQQHEVTEEEDDEEEEEEEEEEMVMLGRRRPALGVMVDNALELRLPSLLALRLGQGMSPGRDPACTDGLGAPLPPMEEEEAVTAAGGVATHELTCLPMAEEEETEDEEEDVVEMVQLQQQLPELAAVEEATCAQGACSAAVAEDAALEVFGAPAMVSAFATPMSPLDSEDEDEEGPGREAEEGPSRCPSNSSSEAEQELQARATVQLLQLHSACTCGRCAAAAAMAACPGRNASTPRAGGTGAPGIGSKPTDADADALLAATCSISGLCMTRDLIRRLGLAPANSAPMGAPAELRAASSALPPNPAVSALSALLPVGGTQAEQGGNMGCSSSSGKAVGEGECVSDAVACVRVSGGQGQAAEGGLRRGMGSETRRVLLEIVEGVAVLEQRMSWEALSWKPLRQVVRQGQGEQGQGREEVQVEEAATREVRVEDEKEEAVLESALAWQPLRQRVSWGRPMAARA